MAHRDRDRSGLQTALADIQARWGTHALRTLGKSQSIPHLSTGFAALDRALGTGGLPRGYITEFSGAPTSGMNTLALKAIGQAHAAGELAVYVDVPNTFDPDYAIRCGVDPASLLVVRPEANSEALDIANTLVSVGGTSVIVCNFASEKAKAGSTEPALRRLVSSLSLSACVFICLWPFDGDASGSEHAAVRLRVERQRWLFRRQNVQGYRVQVTILRNKFSAPRRPVSIVIGFSTTVHGAGA